MKGLLCAAGTAALSAAMISPARAQQPLGSTPADAGASTAAEVVVTGTRLNGVRAEDSAAPIQVVGQTALKQTGATDLATALTSAVPSLNIDTNGGDQAGNSIQAALRGLSPNDTLVLVDGKRRHDTSNLAVDSDSPYSGAATVDLSFIPIYSIDHIEVLTDGAAAQYGTDAIAGVVNIILKKDSQGGQIIGTGGQNYDGQGQSQSVSLNKGFNLADRGYINFTLEERYHDYTTEGIGDARYQNPDGTLRSGLPYPLNNVANAQGFPYENKSNGTPSYNAYDSEYNAAYRLSDKVEFYALGTLGYRDSQHYGNYRPPNNVVGVTSAGQTYYPLAEGFSPKQSTDEVDYSFTEGLRGQALGWRYDLASTYGEDKNKIHVLDSGNDALFATLAAQSASQISPQRNFFDGGFVDTELTNTVDVSKNFSVGLAAPLNVAFGGEWRRDTFSVIPGELASYFGGGSQSYDGLTPLDKGTYHRTNYAVYVDLATNPTANLHTDLAGRYEHYSDFGYASVGKFTTRYDFNPEFAVRGTVSSGFRAPTLAEEFYSGTNTGATYADVQLPPNSAAAQLAGFQPLKPEISTSFSVGFVAHPMRRLQITADVYDIHLENRIGLTGFVFGSVGSSVVSQGVLDAIQARGVTVDSGLAYVGLSTFTNAATTTTTGLDVTANYTSELGRLGRIDWTVGFNYNNTSIDSIAALPTVVTSTGALATALDQGPGAPILNPAATAALTTEIPEEKAIVQALWRVNRWSVTARSTIYGKTSITDISSYTDLPFTVAIPTTPIFDYDIGYDLTRNIRLDVGANNALNTLPPRLPNINGIPASNTIIVYRVPVGGGQGGFAPFGASGGYYYGRVTVTF